MRISTSMIYDSMKNSIMEKQGDLNSLNQKMALGNKFIAPSENPIAANKELLLSNKLSMLNQYVENISAAEGRISEVSSKLEQALEGAIKIKELAVEANNSTLTENEYKIVGESIKRLSNQIESLMNSKNENGDYIFSGSKSNSPAFVSNGSDYVYNGDALEQQVQTNINSFNQTRWAGSNLFNTVSGTSGAIINVDSGNSKNELAKIENGGSYNYNGDLTVNFKNVAGVLNYEVIDSSTSASIIGDTVFSGSINIAGININFPTPNAGDAFNIKKASTTNIKDTADKLSNFLDNTSGKNNIEINSNLSNFLNDIENSINKMIVGQTSVGSENNAILEMKNYLKNDIYSVTENKSEVTDLDYAEAISNYQKQLLSYEAALKTSSEISKLSLFNFI